MDKSTRIRLYLFIAVLFFTISLFELDFDDLTWAKNSKTYIRMMIATLVYIVIFISSKKLNKNS